MKNSNKWVLAALLLLLGSLTAYNMGLRAEYRRGAYKNPLRDTTALAFKDFDEVDVPAAGALNVKIVQGPFGVRLRDGAAKLVRVRQQGPRLTVTLSAPSGYVFWGFGDVLTVTCPHLTQLRTDAVYEQKGKPVTDKLNQNWGGGEHLVQVQGFTEDSLTVRQDHASHVELAHNQIGYLRATSGPGPGSLSVLRVAASNRIGAANFDVRHQSELVLGSAIPRLRYQFADSAKATFSGAALGQLRP